MSEPAPAISALIKSESQDSNQQDANRGAADVPANCGTDSTRVIYPDPPGYFLDALQDGERLLKYAAEMGVEVDETTRCGILTARAAVTTGWNEATAANLLASLTALASHLKPVTAESLRNFDTRPTVRTYWIWVLCLAVVIVPFSLASFVTAALSNTIRTDITSANDLAVKLTAQFGAFANAANGTAGSSGASSLPAGVSPIQALTDLQTFASQTRSIYARARQLDRFILGRVWDPFTETLKKNGYKQTFQLPIPMPVELGPVVSSRVSVYQDSRYFAQEVIDDVSVFYGAIATCILPVLYALLGTCAYLLRSFQQEMRTRTFIPSHSDSARFLIAAIVGGVVGLFNNFTVTQGASIPPLAIAFLVGYSVDVFFSFIETLIEAFSKSKNRPGTPAVAAAKD